MHTWYAYRMSIRSGLLALLAEEPRHGYQLRVDFEERTGATWPLNIGQVYTTLARLERDGLVRQQEAADSDAASTVYEITDAGRVEVGAWFATPVSRTAPPRDELAIKLALAVTLPGVDVRAIVQAQRTATIRALQDYTRLKARAGDSAADLAWSLVVESLIFAAEAEVRWLDHCESRLARHALPAATGATTATTAADTTSAATATSAADAAAAKGVRR